MESVVKWKELDGFKAFKQGLPSTFCKDPEWYRGWCVGKRMADRRVLTMDKLKQRRDRSPFWKSSAKAARINLNKPCR